jgi:hypothetical protein
MTEKTTVGIDKGLRKTIKKLAVWLDISQGEVIKRAIAEYEKSVISNIRNQDKNKNINKKEVEKILQAATDTIWAEDPKSKEIQLKLLQGSETIDDFIANDWDSGLDL